MDIRSEAYNELKSIDCWDYSGYGKRGNTSGGRREIWVGGASAMVLVIAATRYEREYEVEWERAEKKMVEI